MYFSSAGQAQKYFQDFWAILLARTAEIILSARIFLCLLHNIYIVGFQALKQRLYSNGVQGTVHSVYRENINNFSLHFTYRAFLKSSALFKHTALF